MKENENLPAFPHVVYNQNDGHWDGRYEIYKQEGGMTLRDYFAGKVIAECLRNTAAAVESGDSHLDAADIPKQSAIDAYIVADAMLAARKEQP